MTWKKWFFLAACAIGCAALGCSDDGGSCTPDCSGRQCGGDGCGGACGVCTNGTVCRSALGICYDPNVCTPDCNGRQCGDDGCGGSCGTCTNGTLCGLDGICFAEPCRPDCSGRQCGDDGCGGSCGICTDDTFCSTEQLCLEPLISGRLLYERQNIELNDSRIPKFTSRDNVPAAGFPLVLTDAAGTELGQTITDDDGYYKIQMTRLPEPGDRITVSPLWFVGDELKMAVLQTQQQKPFPPWAWTFSAGDFPGTRQNELAEVVISIGDGSGALYLFEQIRFAFLNLEEQHFGIPLKELPSMAVVWKPGMVWDTGTSYVDSDMQAITLNDQIYTLKKTMRVDGNSKNESAWGTPTLLHEFGHYIMFRQRDDNPGGTHYIFIENDPNLAWSEGWATFYSLMAQSYEQNHLVTDYWRLMESSASYYVDYAKIQDPLLTDNGSGAKESGYMDMPSLDHEKGMKQRLSEAWVTSLLLNLWDGADFPDSPHSPDPIAASITSFWNALSSDRYVKLGYYNYYPGGGSGIRTESGSDLVDFIDAMICTGGLDTKTFYQWMDDEIPFPYDKIPVCTREGE